MSGAGVRLADALLRSVGGRTVLLRLPAPAIVGDPGEQLGLAAPQFQDTPLGPAAFRRLRAAAQPEGVVYELLVSASAVHKLVGSLDFNSAGVLFSVAAGVLVDGTLLEITSAVSAEAFGEVYLYCLALRGGRRRPALNSHYERRGNMSVQDIKDTFYAALRNRVAACNADRTLVLRGVTRPAVLVLENELPGAAPEMSDLFSLSWTAVEIDPLGMAKLTCEIAYATAGSTGAGGMDRGRTLAAMDQELRTALDTTPQTAPLQSYAEIQGGGAATETAAGSNIFWTGVVLAATRTQNERLKRTATVEVFGYD